MIKQSGLKMRQYFQKIYEKTVLIESNHIESYYYIDITLKLLDIINPYVFKYINININKIFVTPPLLLFLQKPNFTCLSLFVVNCCISSVAVLLTTIQENIRQLKLLPYTNKINLNGNFLCVNKNAIFFLQSPLII